MTKKKVLVTGGAGFIGSHLTEKLLDTDHSVVVIDNFNNFYNPAIKRANVKAFENNPDCKIVEGDIRNKDDVERAFDHGPFDSIVHLAAMAGVRPSLENPTLYCDVNVQGTQNLLEAASKADKLPLFAFASSSSVYGERQSESFKETDRCDKPISPYAATKMSGEMICHALHRATGMDIVCLRFFTVFGPRQRPDLAIHKFCRLIDNDNSIDMYGDGSSQRDYTYIGDIVSGIMKVLNLKNPGFEVINLGRSEPVVLKDMIACIETALGKKAKINKLPMQKGDVPNTFASIEKARTLLGYNPTTGLEKGVNEFVEWYKKELKELDKVKSKDCALTN